MMSSLAGATEVLVGKRLLLTAEGTVIAVPPDAGRVVCFHADWESR